MVLLQLNGFHELLHETLIMNNYSAPICMELLFIWQIDTNCHPLDSIFVSAWMVYHCVTFSYVYFSENYW